ncbi:hypothetical protein Tco_1204039 [Tanacetum coccineum]
MSTSATHNAIMEASGKDHAPMLVAETPQRYLPFNERARSRLFDLTKDGEGKQSKKKGKQSKKMLRKKQAIIEAKSYSAHGSRQAM